jgi:hypothetical protein
MMKLVQWRDSPLVWSRTAHFTTQEIIEASGYASTSCPDWCGAWASTDSNISGRRPCPNWRCLSVMVHPVIKMPVCSSISSPDWRLHPQITHRIIETSVCSSISYQDWRSTSTNHSSNHRNFIHSFNCWSRLMVPSTYHSSNWTLSILHFNVTSWRCYRDRFDINIHYPKQISQLDWRRNRLIIDRHRHRVGPVFDSLSMHSVTSMYDRPDIDNRAINPSPAFVMKRMGMTDRSLKT